MAPDLELEYLKVRPRLSCFPVYRRVFAAAADRVPTVDGLARYFPAETIPDFLYMTERPCALITLVLA